MEVASFSPVSLEDTETGLHCQPCLRDAETVDAHWFCVDCDDFLCDACHKAHRKIKTLQPHVVMDKSQARIRDLQQAANTAEPHSSVTADTTLCGQHAIPEDHFCYRCLKLCCQQCVAEDHAICTPKPAVPDETNLWLEERNTETVQFFITQMKTISQGLTDGINKVDTRHTEVAETVRDLIGGFNDLLKYLVGDVLQTVSLINERNVTNCELTISRAEAAHREILNVQQRLNDDNYGSVADLMKDVENVNNALQYITFGASEEEAISSHKASMEAMQQVSTFMEHLLGFSSTELAPVSADMLDDLSCYETEDKHAPYITGALITRSRLVVADRGNQAVKIYDREKKGQLITQVHLEDLFNFKPL